MPRMIDPNGLDGPHGELNVLALTDLTKWVPELGLLRYRRRRGAAASYEAVATWRASNTGRELAKRDFNLKISPLGIRDFGDDRGYSPLDLVMAARGVSLSEAVAWLDARLGWSTGGPEIVVEASAAAKGRQHPQAEIHSTGIGEEAYTGGWGAPPEEPAPDADAAQQAADDNVLKEAGAWLHGDSLPTPPECSFEGFLPKVGAGLLVGQLGCCKTHVLVDFAVAMADPAAVSNFVGRKRVRRGGVVLFDFEDSSAPLRIACAAKHRGLPTDTLLPLLVLPTAPSILRKKRINADAVKWYRTALGAADRLFKRRFGLPLVAVAVDPLIDAADFDNEQDNAETNRAMLAFDGLGRELGCLFVVADHAGKDISKGARGGSAKGGKARFILTLPEKVANHAEHRTLTVKKQRNLPDGWGVELWFELVEVESADGKTATNLAACWGAEGQGEDDQDEISDGVRLPRLQLAALGVLRELVTAVTPCRGEQVAWVSLEAWYAELVNQTIIEPDDLDRRKVFKRIKDGLRDKRAIKIHGEKVCIPL
jgi:hypothetical protein